MIKKSENIKKTIMLVENEIVIGRYSLKTLDSPLVKQLIKIKNSKLANQPAIIKTLTAKIMPIKLVVIMTNEP